MYFATLMIRGGASAFVVVHPDLLVPLRNKQIQTSHLQRSCDSKTKAAGAYEEYKKYIPRLLRFWISVSPDINSKFPG